MCYTNVVFQQPIKKSVNRQQIQRERLDDRVGPQSRFQTAGNLIFRPQEKSTLAVTALICILLSLYYPLQPNTTPPPPFTAQQRFSKDHTQHDKLFRQQQKQAKDRFYQARLNKRLQRQQDRWQQQDRKVSRQQHIRQGRQQILLDNKKNTNGQAYNPITHNYQPSNRGQQLQQRDQHRHVSNLVRTRNLISHGGANWNIVTGQDKSLPIPDKLRGQVEGRWQVKKEAEKIKYQPQRDKYDYLDD